MTEAAEILGKLDDGETRTAIIAERALLSSVARWLPGPLGAWARLERGELVMEAVVCSVDGVQYVRHRATARPIKRRNWASVWRNCWPKAGHEIFWKRSAFSWLKRRKALAGKRVVVTRAAEQSESLSAALREQQAIPIALPLVAFAPPEDLRPLDDTIRNLGRYDWVFLTSQNALRALQERSDFLGLQLAKILVEVSVAAVGPATANPRGMPD